MKKILLLTTMLLVGSSVAFAQESYDRLDKMIAPLFHPVNFEDPRNTTELRFIHAHHTMEGEFVTGGGTAKIYALQARLALSDRWSLIATKDGYIDMEHQAVLADDTGWGNIEAGAKYAFLMDKENGQIASAQLRYEIPTGDEEVLQGEGDGIIHPSVSGAYALSDAATFTYGTGLRLAVDSGDSSLWDVDTQVDYRIDTDLGAFYPLVGLSLIKVIDAGDRLPIGDEGQDYFNFGASQSEGETMVIGGAGLRYRIGCDFDLGAGYQFPMFKGENDGNYVIDHRWTFDAIYRF
jgi:hypothetical protein